MNALDRAIGWVAPRAALSRARARHALRIYEGASVGRRTSSFKALNTSANAEIQGALRPLRSRARELARNTPYAARMLDVMVAHTVGTGITPVPDTGSDVLDHRLENIWGEWDLRADVTGQLTFCGMQALAVRAMMESGESVIRFIDRPLDDHRRVPLQLQLLEGDFIDQWRDGIYGNDGHPGTEGLEHSRLGVGLGEFDRRVGLWLNPNHPGEINTANLRPGVSTFVPADELIHLFKVLRPGQVRGVSWFAPILMTARDLADFMDAVNVKARVEACFSGFITNNDEAGGDLFDQANPGLAGRSGANPDAQLTSIEPGMLKELRQGQDIKFAAPTSTSQVSPIIMYNLQAMAVGVGCTYDQATGDLKGATFSSMKAGKIDFRRLVEQLQNHAVVPMLCQRTRDRFVSRAILAGILPDSPECYRTQWVTPAWEPINPNDDIEADIKAVRTGRMPPQEFVAAWGNDWRKVQDQTRAFYRRADAMGLAFDIDPRRTDQSGKQQPPAGGTQTPKDDTGEPIAAPALS
ncbi:phage portal protein [Methylobacterium sp. E-046]|uniref:phage portal protein n=1 Tax=Methylobacterium sp. E-046 TaxID=2836576 RepID=UPI001FB88B78|nr:phage portal protein [Methylobacterium sp. E-046]MCJ2102447.1 phage portal protein [Methylobacterium sp. E-046]